MKRAQGRLAMTLFYLNFLHHAVAKAAEPPRHCQALSAAHEDQVVGWTRSSSRCGQGPRPEKTMERHSLALFWGRTELSFAR